jgi:hypothetical protein
MTVYVTRPTTIHPGRSIEPSKIDAAVTTLEGPISPISSSEEPLTPSDLEKALGTDLGIVESYDSFDRYESFEKEMTSFDRELAKTSAMLGAVEYEPSVLHKEFGRPDVGDHIAQMIASSSKTDRIMVSCCGPTLLMSEVRNLVARSVSMSGPSITLCNEQFGW